MIFLNVEVNDSLGSGDAACTLRTPVDRGGASKLKCSAALEVHKKKSSAGIHRDVAKRVEHAVSVVVGEHEMTRVDYSDETGAATLVRDVSSMLRMIGCYEESVGMRDLLLLLRGQ